MNLIKELLELTEAQTGARVTYDNYDMWKNELPKKSTFHKDGSLERAQAIGKELEGVAGTWDAAKKTGWIYEYYLNKKNLHENLYEGFGPEMSAAIKTVSDIFKKAGKKVSTRVAKSKLANLYAGPFEKNEETDILFEAGFRQTKTDSRQSVLRRGKIYVVIRGQEKDAKLHSFEVSTVSAEEAAEKDKADAKWGASYKGMKFKKWEGE